ncbi:hypothetical protein [Photobacterium leiognathi]|uniref:hypothetical protein n=1 Tax=Photobacterium leiognathi TaxID=553611 RepID=UPI0029820275|nr:hypothetical protein [Photobacterium leiognathi]
MSKSSLDELTFKPQQEVSAKTLINNSEFMSFANDKILTSDSTSELFSNAMAIDSQSKLRTVRRILMTAKDSNFIELKKAGTDSFITITKCRDCFKENGFKVEVTFYNRHKKHCSSSVAYYSVSEAILQAVKDGYTTHCDGYYKELFYTDKVLARINHRVNMLNSLAALRKH